MKKSAREGFLMMEALLEVMAVSVLMVSVMTACAEAFRFSEQVRHRACGVFLLQDTMEKIKYRHIFQRDFPNMEEAVVMNGEIYTVEIREEHCLIEEIPLKKISCAVTDSQGQRVQAVTALLEES